MKTLRMLGGLWLEPNESRANGRALQRQRLALLAVMSLSPNRRVTRDKLLALLWPESTAAQGRHRLSTAVYDVRQALGDDVVRSVGDELWIATDAGFQCDAEVFEQAIAVRDWEQADATYQGPLLDGVHLRGLYEFDEWLSTHRERLRRLHADVLERLIERREQRADRSGVINAARRLSDAEPLSARVAVISATAIAQNGESVEAVQMLEQHAGRVEQELGVVTSPEVLALLRHLRTSGKPGSPFATIENAQSNRHPARAKEFAATTSDRTPWSGSIRVAASMAIASVLVFAAAGAVVAARRPDASTELGGVLVQLSNHAKPIVSDATADAIREQLATALAAVGVCAVGGMLEDTAAADGHCLVTGQFAERDSVVVISAMLHARHSGASISSADAPFHADSMEATTAQLTRELLASAMVSIGNDFAASAVRSSPSAPALKAFLTGEVEYRNGFYPAAHRSYQAAVTADSTFALAHYRLSQALLWEDVPAHLASLHDSQALRFANRLPEDARLLVEAYNDWRVGKAAHAESLYRVIVKHNPRDVEAWFQLAETLFHYNAIRGRGLEDAIDAFSIVAKLDSVHWGARWHLALLAADRVPAPTLNAYRDALLRGHNDGYIAAEMRLFASDTGAALISLASNANATVLFDAAWRRAVYRRDLIGAETLLRRMAEGDRPPLEQEKARYLVAALRFGRGDTRAALSMLPFPNPSADASEALVIAATAVVGGELHEGLANPDSLYAIATAWRKSLRATGSMTPERQVTAEYVLGILAAARGLRAVALSHAVALDTVTQNQFVPHQLAEAVRAVSAFRGGSCAETMKHLDGAVYPMWLGIVASQARASGGLERLLRANCFARMGHHREAVAWYRTIEQNTLYDFALLGPALRGQAKALRALGDTQSANTIDVRLASRSVEN